MHSADVSRKDLAYKVPQKDWELYMEQFQKKPIWTQEKYSERFTL